MFDFAFDATTFDYFAPYPLGWYAQWLSSITSSLQTTEWQWMQVSSVIGSEGAYFAASTRYTHLPAKLQGVGNYTVQPTQDNSANIVALGQGYTFANAAQSVAPITTLIPIGDILANCVIFKSSGAEITMATAMFWVHVIQRFGHNNSNPFIEAKMTAWAEVRIGHPHGPTENIVDDMIIS